MLTLSNFGRVTSGSHILLQRRGLLRSYFITELLPICFVAPHAISIDCDLIFLPKFTGSITVLFIKKIIDQDAIPGPGLLACRGGS